MRCALLPRLAIAALFLLPSSFLSGGTAQAQTSTPLPSRMAAIGDSFTQAADVCCWYGNHRSISWSTGGAGWDGVRSHYERIRALNPRIAGRNHNNSVSGARMKNAPAQAAKTVAQRPRYVTILMGANDVCTSSPDTMTSVDTFRSQFRETLSILISGLPGTAHIFVSSIPNVYQLWQLYSTDSSAQLVWDVANICQSMLAPTRTEEQRLFVGERNAAFNTVLAEECAAVPRCKFDRFAVFDHRFSRRSVSKLDYFHPSLSGQAQLAWLTWKNSWWY